MKHCYNCGLRDDDPGRIGIAPRADDLTWPRYARLSPKERQAWSDKRIGATRCPVCGKAS